MKIHDVINASRLKLWHGSDRYGDREYARPPPLEDTTDIFLVERILDKRTTTGKGRRTEYLVQWQGYPIYDATWEPISNLLGTEPVSVNPDMADLPSSSGAGVADAPNQAAQPSPAPPAAQPPANRSELCNTLFSLNQRYVTLSRTLADRLEEFGGLELHWDFLFAQNEALDEDITAKRKELAALQHAIHGTTGYLARLNADHSRLPAVEEQLSACQSELASITAQLHAAREQLAVVQRD
ncbi:hypothetical protein N2152v2_007825 [Parachlorella kessleri]